MKIDSYMPFYGNDFFQATEGHSEAVTIGYIRAIWHYWHHLHCDGLPDDDDYLRRLCRCEQTSWKRTKGIIFGEFFKLMDGKWHNKKAREEYAEAAENYQARVERVNKARALKSAVDIKVDIIPCNQELNTTLDRTSGSGSGSGSTGRGEGATAGKPECDGEKRVTHNAATLAVEACRVFNPKAIHPPQAIVSNVMELLRGHTADDLRCVFKAVSDKAFEYPPRSPDSLTDPGKFDGLLALAKNPVKTQPGATSAQCGASGRREAWKIEKDIAAIQAARRKIAAKIPFGTSHEAEAARDKWKQTAEAAEYARLGRRKNELERELREAR